MQTTNIIISPEEMEVIKNYDFFYTKHRVSTKIKDLLAVLRDEYKTVIKESQVVIPSDVDIQVGKIFQGENYKLLPYILLDYPKLFNKKSVFSFRTMFWWGNFFSCTLHLGGEAYVEKANKIEANYNILLSKDVYVSVGATPWEYDYVAENYKPAEQININELINSHRNFIKISRKISLNDYGKLSSFGTDTLRLFLKLLE